MMVQANLNVNQFGLELEGILNYLTIQALEQPASWNKVGRRGKA